MSGIVNTYLSPDEVAAMLRVDRKSVYSAIRAGRLPALRVGRVLRVSVDDLQTLAVEPSCGGPADTERRSRPREPAGEFAKLARGV